MHPILLQIGPVPLAQPKNALGIITAFILNIFLEKKFNKYKQGELL